MTGLTLEHDRHTGGGRDADRRADAPAAGHPRPQTTMCVNPYTGAIIGQVDLTSPWRRFFRITTDWHR